MIITSKDNEQIKHIRKLKDKKFRDKQGEFFVEGMKLVREAIDEGADIKTIVICDECEESGKFDKRDLYEIAKHNCIYVNERVFNHICDVQNPQGILAVIGKMQNTKEIEYNEDLIVILDGVQDPGNMGTILRTLDSVGLSQVIVSNICVDVYNPKVVRATMGAVFRINIIESEDLTETIKELKKNKIELVVTALDTNKSIYDVEYKKMAVVIGNEVNGVSPEIAKMADRKAKIPMFGRTESLNAAVAASVVLYEYVRQKVTKK